MRKLILITATFVTAFSGIAHAESPNLGLLAERMQQEAQASQDRSSKTATFGFSNPIRLAPAHLPTKSHTQPIGVSPEATELRRTLFGR